MRLGGIIGLYLCSLAQPAAAERYQGGDLIAMHPAVRLLLGDARSRVMASAAHVATAAHENDTSIDGLLRAVACRLRVAASRASIERPSTPCPSR